MKKQTYTDIYMYEQNHWWYKARRKLALFLIERYARKERNKSVRILDVGCGTGGLMKELVHLGEVTGIDMSEEAVAFCKKRGIYSVYMGKIEQLPFEDNSFDVVVALDILEHIDDDAQGAKELYRVLKPNGLAVVFVPALMLLWGTTDVAGQHKRRYTKKEINNCLKGGGGFSIVRSTYFNTILFIPILVVRLLARLLKYKVVDEFRPGVSILNKLFYGIFSMEIVLLRTVSFPIGVSIFSVCKKEC